MAKDVIITLHVYADKLASGTPNEQKVLNNCYLTDDNGGSAPPGKNPKEFESHVFKNMKVKWEGKSESDGYEIAIMRIDEISGTNLFVNRPPFHGTGGKNSRIQQKLRDDSGVNGKGESYEIHFDIYHGDTKKNSLSIDPKLKMSTVERE